jgi:cyanophycinase
MTQLVTLADLKKKIMWLCYYREEPDSAYIYFKKQFKLTPNPIVMLNFDNTTALIKC